MSKKFRFYIPFSGLCADKIYNKSEQNSSKFKTLKGGKENMREMSQSVRRKESINAQIHIAYKSKGYSKLHYNEEIMCH